MQNSSTVLITMSLAIACLCSGAIFLPSLLRPFLQRVPRLAASVSSLTARLAYANKRVVNQVSSPPVLPVRHSISTV